MTRLCAADQPRRVLGPRNREALVQQRAQTLAQAVAVPHAFVLAESDEGRELLATVDDPAVAAAASELAGRLQTEQFEGLTMAEVISYWSLPPGNPLASTDHTKGLILARFPDDDATLVDFSATLKDRYVTDAASPITVQTSSPASANASS